MVPAIRTSGPLASFVLAVTLGTIDVALSDRAYPSAD
jgi:hypothetical protein